MNGSRVGSRAASQITYSEDFVAVDMRQDNKHKKKEEGYKERNDLGNVKPA